MNAPRDFDIGVARQLAQSDKQAARINSYAVGPGLADFYGDYSGLPGLRGLWFPGSVTNLGDVADQSGQGRALTLVGNPTLALNAVTVPPVLLPHYDLDGTGDFFLRADEAGLDILGTETYIAAASQGLTVGGWFNSSTMTGNEGLITKYTTAGNQQSYALLFTGNQAEFIVSSTGANNLLVLSAALAVDTWYFVVGRYAPSAEIAVFVNDVKVVNTTSIPAALFNSTAGLIVGGLGAGISLLTGRWALSFLCAAYLPDYFLTYLWKRGQVHFGI